MSSTLIRRQYDEVIADHYDVDPLSVVNDALDRALDHLQREGELAPGLSSLSVLDLGMGTGLFLEKLREQSDREIQPFGLDISARMIEIAHNRIPDLEAVVDDAANFHEAFADRTFDLVCTHFVTGFVPLDDLAPRIWRHLKPGGCWSFVGGTSGGYPALQRKARSLPIRIAFRGRRLDLDALLTPASIETVTDKFREIGFETCAAETFEPELFFGDFNEFMAFAYHGGWLTPFIEELGLHKARPHIRRLLNKLVFPLRDCHKIAIGLAKKPLDA